MKLTKKLFVVICLIYSLSCIAKTPSSDHWPKKFISLGFVNSTIKQKEALHLTSNYGVSFSVGRTFYLHKPIGGCFRFGIDASWLDLNYTNYKIQHITPFGLNNYNIHEAEVALQVGPSISINPVSKMVIHGYFRFAPSLSCFYYDEKFHSNYASYFLSGASISYRAVGVGFEWRHGNSEFQPLLNLNSSAHNNSSIATNTNGFRTFLIFKF